MTFRENRQRVTDPSGHLMFLQIVADGLPETLRIVNDTQNWTSQGLEYIGFPFGFKLPDDTAGQAPRAQLVIDNVGRSMTEDLEQLQPGAVVIAKLALADKSTPNTWEHYWELPIARVSVTTTQVVADLGPDFWMRQQAVSLRFTPHVTPGIF